MHTHEHTSVWTGFPRFQPLPQRSSPFCCTFLLQCCTDEAQSSNSIVVGLLETNLPSMQDRVDAINGTAHGNENRLDGLESRILVRESHQPLFSRYRFSCSTSYIVGREREREARASPLSEFCDHLRFSSPPSRWKRPKVLSFPKILPAYLLKPRAFPVLLVLMR